MAVRVGFIGLGLMGSPMAHAVLKRGFALTVWNRNPTRVEPLVQAGASAADTIAELTRRSDTIITMLTDAAASETVLCGPGGVLQHAQPGTIIVDMGSIAPDMSRSIAVRAQLGGVAMLDAPVTGNPKVAEAGKLGIMVGGEASVVEQVRPVLEAMSAVIVHAGPSGAGSTLKLINNLILGTAIQAVAEAFVLAQKLGIDPERVREITSVGGARTAAMETRGARMIAHDFSPHFSVDNMHKDLSTALDLARAAGASVPAADAALAVLRTARERGLGNRDSAIVFEVLQRRSGLPAVATA